ncbi:MAG: DegT/DnrJ/EryC1/StrS family aminotransferase [Gaiellaceae bacterium]
MTRAYYLVSPPLSPRAYFGRRAKELPFPFDDARCTLYSLARHGLWHGVRALGLGAGDEILVPEYHCGTEIEALLQASLELRWYEQDERLEPSEPALDALVDPRTRALLVIHYLGFPQNAERWRRWCDDRGLLLIEDAAPAWLSSIGDVPVGSFGDLSIFSFRKTYGVPDGGALVSDTGGAQIRPTWKPGLGMLLKRHAAWAAMRLRVAATALKIWMARGPFDVVQDDPDSHFAMGDPRKPPQRISLALLSHMSGASVAARRRDNYRYLLDHLGEFASPPFDHLPGGASPYMFPLTVENRDDLIRQLRSRGVHAVSNWPVPHPACPASRFPGSEERRATIVGLPVHHELRQRDLEYIVAAVKRSLEEAGQLPATGLDAS